MKRAILVFVLLAVSAAPAGMRDDAELTASQEYYVGRAVAAQTLKKYRIYHRVDDPLQTYVTLVGETVALESDRPITFKGYHFIVLDTPDVNAFAAPSGFVFITTGLLRLLKTEDELAGVLAHEIAHVNLRHPELVAQKATDTHTAKAAKDAAKTADDVAEGIGGLLGKKIPKGVSKALDYAGVFFGVLEEVFDAVLKGYSREKEEEADKLAVDILVRPGVRYDPRGLRDALGRMQGERTWSWKGSSHPDPKARVALIDKHLATLGDLPATDADRTKAFEEATRPLR